MQPWKVRDIIVPLLKQEEEEEEEGVLGSDENTWERRRVSDEEKQVRTILYCSSPFSVLILLGSSGHTGTQAVCFCGARSILW